ncbi:serine hydrolase [Nonomuraea gerenzanensis]|uniref:Beta-lactamase n=1 Tax=Nonomuraea gerenzanensis TaxID=93944 RepID=A0A1M4EN07_9ACTN|nr:serine hydrolase [Nonomuraea gerenzanensis]UBU11719.1 serine hydrolase [Nonomuraea gerenzanensis]SBP00219.1 Beta-lactamase [Nonomuraea gerenzanensis]
MHTPSKPVRILAAATAAIAMTACAGRPVPAEATSAGVTAPVSAAPEVPATPAGRQLAWLLDASTRLPITDDELAGHFTADFLKNIPPAQLNQALAGFENLKLERVEQSHERELLARVLAGASAVNVVISVDADGLMSGLRFMAPDPTTWAEVDERLRTLSPRTGFLAAELTPDGRCRPLHGVAAGERRPLGSMLKLYVLGAVAERIRSGAFGWDTKLTITPELKSLPSGELQDRPDGSQVTVLEAAKLMISISDNTATDLLIHKVGRKAVERTMRAWGVNDQRNVPFLTTRDLFVLKGVDYPRHAKRYLSLNDAGQRAYLEKVVAKTPLSKFAMWSAPRELDTLEWYASPAQICRAYAGLVKLGDRRVGEVMSISDGGLGLDRAQWPTVWFKGGSEPGVSDAGFLARTKQGRTYVVTTMAIDPKAPIGAHVWLEQTALSRGAFALAKAS